ncbi:uncharacterized protein LOC132389825 isoform X2 [Hypanus sabinus]|uniref:uncharacterized protein LOC132389825 isoform X2 n=1 Tax=Hypanus sabinus TaxID=79690 RepID=UPI0028C3E386|nr:uncharacterized protein LOC132389825 isoform X2 [Hypanus sabinus]
MVPVLFLLVSSLVIEGSQSQSCSLRSDVLCTTADYQIRSVRESVWVGTRVNAWSTVFRRKVYRKLLYRYTRGANSAGVRIQSTGQFLTSVTTDGEATMYLMLPKQLWENPPTPTHPEVFITRFPRMDVFARKIRRNVTIWANDFNRTLTEQNAHFNKSIFFIVACTGNSSSADSSRDRRSAEWKINDHWGAIGGGRERRSDSEASDDMSGMSSGNSSSADSSRDRRSAEWKINDHWGAIGGGRERRSDSEASDDMSGMSSGNSSSADSSRDRRSAEWKINDHWGAIGGGRERRSDSEASDDMSGMSPGNSSSADSSRDRRSAEWKINDHWGAIGGGRERRSDSENPFEGIKDRIGWKEIWFVVTDGFSCPIP